MTLSAELEAVQRLLQGAKVEAFMAIGDAADLIWHSMQKYDGNPTQTSWHPINCGCTFCN